MYTCYVNKISWVYKNTRLCPSLYDWEKIVYY